MKNINISELPYDDFEKFGLRKNDILNLPTRTLNALLSGNKTELLRLNSVKIEGLKEPIQLDGKINLVKDEQTGFVSINFTPVKKIVENKFDLTQIETDKLLKNETGFVEKEMKDKAGNLIPMLISHDKMTNEFTAIRKDTIEAPLAINDILLTDKQKQDFKNGKPIKVADNEYILNWDERSNGLPQ
jgi:hypothetical protein